jgi:phosphoenolpyruvate synthase/pyruvate phosphate dikinase
MKSYITSLDSESQATKSDVGGKGLSLLWIVQQGFRTAPGFIVTTEAFIDGQFGGAGLQSEIDEAIRSAYQQLGGRVAVRSSMVGEDSADASFAGSTGHTPQHRRRGGGCKNRPRVLGFDVEPARQRIHQAT